MQAEIVIAGGTLVSPTHGQQVADLLIDEHGRISGQVAPGTSINAKRRIEANGRFVLPGAIDPHTHWGNYGAFAEDCRKESRNAALGGTTTALLFQRVAPDDKPAIPTKAANLPFSEICEIAQAGSAVDFGLTPIIHDEDSASMVPELIDRRGCTSFKFYLAYKDLKRAPHGDDWNKIDDGQLWQMFQYLGAQQGTVACVHAENAEIINHAMRQAEQSGRAGDGLAAWERANPAIAEAEAVLRAAYIAERSGLPLYAVHMSGTEALDALRRVRRNEGRIYGETCTHYLMHCSEESPPSVKFSPPIRYRSDRDALWKALASGEISCVASDSVCTPHSLKSGGVWNVARGAPCAGILVPALLSEGVAKGRLTLEQVVAVTSENTARIFGLFPRKGTLAVGADADLMIVDMSERRKVGTVFPEYEDYSDLEFTGWPVMTMRRGRIIAERLRIAEQSVPGAQYQPRGRSRPPLSPQPGALQ